MQIIEFRSKLYIPAISRTKQRLKILICIVIFFKKNCSYNCLPRKCASVRHNWPQRHEHLFITKKQESENVVHSKKKGSCFVHKLWHSFLYNFALITFNKFEQIFYDNFMSFMKLKIFIILFITFFWFVYFCISFYNWIFVICL